MFLFPTLNWKGSNSLIFKPDKLQVTKMNYVLLSVCFFLKILAAALDVVVPEAVVAGGGGRGRGGVI
jgi:hypothetical protein